MTEIHEKDRKTRSQINTLTKSREKLNNNRIHKLLSGISIRLLNTWKEKPEQLVPPSSPRDDLKLITYEPLPSHLPNVKNLNVPYIKIIGVKSSIEKLGDYFQCNKYKTNLLHFWFLDILTDCLWKTQDEFNLVESDQKIVLQWIIYLFNLIRDPKLNYDRKTFICIIKEAILLACDVICEYNCEIPLPEDLFTLIKQDDENKETISLANNCNCDIENSKSTISNFIYDAEGGSFLKFNLDDKLNEYKLGKQICTVRASSETSCSDSSPDASFKSSETAFSAVINSEEEIKVEGKEEVEEEEEEEENSEEEIEYYKADPSLPMRFRPIKAYENYIEKPYPKPPPYNYDIDLLVEEEHKFEEEQNLEEMNEEEASESVKTENRDLGFYEISDEDYKKLDNDHIKGTTVNIAQKSGVNIAQKSGVNIPQKSGVNIVQKSGVNVAQKSGVNIAQKSGVNLPQKSGVNVAQKSGVNVAQKSKTNIEKSKSNILAQTHIAEEVTPILNEQQEKEEIVKRLTKLKLWELRTKQLNDSKEGWLPTPEPKTSETDTTAEIIFNENEIDPEWIDVDEENEENEEIFTKFQETKFVNFGVLHAIVDFIFDYFYENFNFTLIKLAYQNPLTLIVQNVNESWKVPKIPKQELSKPKEPKAKKGKKDKKKDKKSKKGKGSDKSKKSKKSDKSSKKSKKDKGKKGKKEKKHKLTKEEKVELARLKKEQELLEEEQRRLEENRRFVFPLTDAATDELFQSIFENWTKTNVKKSKKDKKGKKGKKK